MQVKKVAARLFQSPFKSLYFVRGADVEVLLSNFAQFFVAVYAVRECGQPAFVSIASRFFACH